jgi:protein-arginine kinase activator protein McsA
VGKVDKSVLAFNCAKKYATFRIDIDVIAKKKKSGRKYHAGVVELCELGRLQIKIMRLSAAGLNTSEQFS